MAATRHPRSPDRQASIERRRRMAMSGVVPASIAASFTMGESAVLAVIGRTVQKCGVCVLPIDALAALAGVSRSLRGSLIVNPSEKGGHFMLFKHNLVAAAIPLMLCALPAPSFAGFCANNAGPSVSYCDDFSGTNPLSNYTIWNGNPPFSSISIVNQQLALQNNMSSPLLAGAFIMYDTPINFHDTVLNADVQFSTSSNVRSLMGVGFWNDVNAPNDNFVTWDLQLDEQNAYIIAVIGGVGYSFPTHYAFQPNTVYDLALVIGGADYALGLVNGQPVFGTTLASLASLPSTMHPGFAGDAYSTDMETLLYSNAIAHSIPEPATWVTMILGFAGLGFAGWRESRRAASLC